MRALIEDFEQRCCRAPRWVAAAPGRINLLGEHTDYNGLPVLPVAIDRRVRIALAERDDATLRVANADPDHAAFSFEASNAIEPGPPGAWGNYVKAAVQGIVQAFERERWRGGDWLVSGDVPVAAGLSSSSALVVASALAFLAANDLHPSRIELAELLAVAERYVGTQGGGMDQAASLLGRAGHALRIDFFPLRTRAVRLPEDVALVACHSLVPAAKAAGARDAYNRRVSECREACRGFERVLDTPPLVNLGELVERFPDRRPAELVELLSTEADPDVVRRCRHVLTEAQRVYRGERLLADGDLEGFGREMFASHASCRDDYDVSGPELDELVQIAADAGALGARLTGAGFGGCTVNLLRRSRVEPFLDAVDRSFYRPRLGRGEDPGRRRFVLAASAGAECVELKD